MKKILFFLMAFVCFGTLASQAQSTDEAASPDEIAVEMDASKTRMAKIAKLLEKRPKTTNLKAIDDFTDQVWIAAASCQETAKKFENLYTRQVSEPDTDGITTVEVTKPSLQDWIDLLALLTNQAVQITSMAPAAAAMPTALTEIRNPMQIKSAKNAIKDTGELFKLIGEENVAEVKAVKGIIELLKSNKNI